MEYITNNDLLLTRTVKFHWTHLLRMEPKSETCVICIDGFGDDSPVNIVYEKGLETVIRVSEEKDATELLKCLLELKHRNQEVKVHHICRRKFTDKRKMSSKQIPTKKRLRSSLEVKFDWKVHCFLCSKSIDFYNKHSHSEVMPLQLRESLTEHGNERNDEWGEDIVCRLLLCNELVAEEAKYHTNCMTKFRLKDGTDKRRGRPEDVQMVKGFGRVCIWLEETYDSEMHPSEQFYVIVT